MGNPFGSDSKDQSKPDGVTTYAANEHDLQSYVDASRQLSHSQERRESTARIGKKPIHDMNWWSPGEAGEFTCPENT